MFSVLYSLYWGSQQCPNTKAQGQWLLPVRDWDLTGLLGDALTIPSSDTLCLLCFVQVSSLPLNTKESLKRCPIYEEMDSHYLRGVSSSFFPPTFNCRWSKNTVNCIWFAQNCTDMLVMVATGDCIVTWTFTKLILYQSICRKNTRALQWPK